MSRSIPVFLLAAGGLAAWWASRAAAGDGTDPVADLLSGKGNSLAPGQRIPVNIERLGADVKLPDQAAEFAALRDFGGAVLERGGQLTVQSPNYVLEVSTPPAVEPVRVEVPVQTSAVLDQQGKYVPLDSWYLFSVTGQDQRWGSYTYRKFGWIDTYVNPAATIPAQKVFRAETTPFPPMGYTLAGVLGLPECLEVSDRERQRYRYYPDKDPNGFWLNKLFQAGFGQLDIIQPQTPS
ncbi:MAG: hypothetical protein N3J91_09195 [Verrucomicrobiae bacterium]|nr:hypothetical protein [Verrucomicrobiae bacterium]